MNVLLITPPVASLFYPPLGLACLQAYIHSNSRHKCRSVDLAASAIRDLLEQIYLMSCEEMLESTMDRLCAKRTLTAAEASHYAATARALAKTSYVRANLETALGTFVDQGAFADRERRRRAIILLDYALAIISAAHYPFEITRDGLRHGTAPNDEPQLVQLLRENRSPFADVMERRLEYEIATFRPQIVGVSINYFGQLIAGLEICRWLRRTCTTLTIVVGGSLMPEIGGRLVERPELRALCDHVISYEGETALLTLLDKAAAGTLSSSAIPNELRLEGERAVVQERHTERMDLLPPPDFSTFRFSDYLSPRPIIPLLTSRGCYWGACAFCTHFHTYGDSYRTLSADTVVTMMEGMQHQYGANQFFFVDECLAPSKARAISEMICTRALQVTWGTEIRLERALTRGLLQLMARAGCRVLSFGLESASQRVLDSMDKGICVADMARILEDAAASGIAPHVMCIVGFPGETDADLEETLRLLRERENILALVGFSPFTLNRNSIVHRTPDRFGVVVHSGADPLRPYLDYEVESGLTQVDSVHLYNEIAGSSLVDRIDLRTAVATREHLLFIDFRELPAAEAGPEAARSKVGGFILSPHYSDALRLPFSIDEATHSPSAGLSRQESVCVFLPTAGKVLELSPDLDEWLLRKFGGQARSDTDDSSLQIMSPIVERRLVSQLLSTGVLELH